jgi:HSP20 family protein
MTITRFRPMTDTVSLRDAMDRLFEESFIRPNTWTGLAAGHVAVPVDLWETKDAYHLRADLPGVTADQLDINATSDSVSISGETKTQSDVTEDGWLRQERRVGKFQRAFTLPMAIDPTKVDATFEHGVLQLTLPKAENVKPRTIKVNAKQ